MQILLPLPEHLAGNVLADEIADGLGLDRNVVSVAQIGGELEVTFPDDANETEVRAAVDAHRPSPALNVDRTSIPPDGETVATVTYTNLRDDAPPRVDFDVNGTVKGVAVSSAGNAILEIASATPGDTVTVAVQGAGTVTVDVEEA